MPSERYYRVPIPGGGSFPPIDFVVDGFMSGVCRRLTDGTATHSDQLVARSYIEAYNVLVNLPHKDILKVVRALRAESKADERSR